MPLLIKPFAALRPTPGYADAVLAPPYDVLSSAEARVRAHDRPWSFLHISKPEIDLPDSVHPYAPEVYAQGAAQLNIMLEKGLLAQDPQPYYYAYRLTMGSHTLTGLVAVASVTAYNHQRIRRHEFTRPDKEDDRVRQITALNAQTGPVLLAYPSDPPVDALLAQGAQGEPVAQVIADDGVRHELWVISEATLIQSLTTAFDAMSYLYIADGHHRSAAASRVAAQRGDKDGGYFLAVIFPHLQMHIMDYNRVVKDLNGLTTSQYLAQLQTRFTVQTTPHAIKPTQAGQLAMYLPGQWYQLHIQPHLIPVDDPVASLDVSLLSDQVLGPILGIHDLRRDTRIDFVGGIRGLTELQRRVDSGEMAVAFALYPTQMAQLMAVADRRQVMPPKSTWFEPKLADGLVSYVLP